MALLLVLSVVAVAAVAGYSILSSNALQAQVGRNAVQGVSAEYLADSGLHLALYQLQQSGGKTWSQSGITLPGIAGTIDITVTKDGSLYTLTATGKIPLAGGGTTLTHRAQAIVRVGDVAAIFRGDFSSIPSGVNILGPIETADSGGGGGLLGGLLGGVLGLIGDVVHILIPDTSIPQATEAKSLLSTASPRTYTYQGQVYAAQPLPYNLTDFQGGPSAANPLGVFYTTTSTTVSNTVINGSLFIFNGRLNVNGAALIIPQGLNSDATGSGTKFPTFPALVIEDKIVINGKRSIFQVNGPTWLQNGIYNSSSAYGMQLLFNGPLTVGGTSTTINPGSQGQITIRPSVQIVSWNSTVPAN
jgi:hypothetical protein